MWDWLITQAQTASPFIASFSLAIAGILARVVVQLYKANEKKQETIVQISSASIQANNAVALAIERSSNTTALAIEGLKAQLQNGGRRR